MKITPYFLLFAAMLTGCKSYNYYTASPNNAFFANAGEAHLGGDIGIYRVDAKGGVALTNNISLTGTYGGAPYNEYHSSEGEVALGFNTSYKKGFNFSAYAGYGLGNNFGRDSGASFKNFYGSFTKPFLQMSAGLSGSNIEGAFTLKFDFMNYSGSYRNGNGTYSSFPPGTFYWEPYFSGSAGGKSLRFEYGTGFAIKKLSDLLGNGVRVFPWQFNIGLCLIINRKNSD